MLLDGHLVSSAADPLALGNSLVHDCLHTSPDPSLDMQLLCGPRSRMRTSWCDDDPFLPSRFVFFNAPRMEKRNEHCGVIGIYAGTIQTDFRLFVDLMSRSRFGTNTKLSPKSALWSLLYMGLKGWKAENRSVEAAQGYYKHKHKHIEMMNQFVGSLMVWALAA